MLTEKQIEEKLAFVRFNMDCEGFTLTEENERVCRQILRGEITGDEAVRQTIEKYGLNIANK